MPAAGYEIDFLKVRGIDRRNPLRAARAGLEALAAVGAARAALLRARGADVVMGGGGFVAGPAGLAAALTRTPLVLTEADSHLGLANRLLAAAGAARLPRLPDRGPRGRAATWSPGGRCRRRCSTADRAAARGALRDRRRRARCLLVVGGSQGARSLNFAAVEAFAEDGEREFHVLHLSGTRDYDEIGARLDRRAPLRALHADRLRARPRRRARRLRPGAGALGRLDLRAHRRRAAGDPRPLPARDRRPPERQRRVDGAGAGAATIVERRRARAASGCAAEVGAILDDARAAGGDGGRSRGAGQARRGAADRRPGAGGGAPRRRRR